MRQIEHAGRAAWVCCLVVGLGSLTEAEAGTTAVGSAGGEASHSEVLGQMFGGSFSSDGLNFTNGSLLAERIDDDLDQIVEPGQYRAEAGAAFAGLSQSFGTLSDSSDGAFNRLFDVTGSGFDVTGSATVDMDESFRWARQGANGTFSTLEQDNRDGEDHVVTYQVSGEGVEGLIRVLFFEDLAGSASDWDFQDLVVRLTAQDGGAGEVVMVPLPTAIVPGLALLLGCAAGRGLHRRRRA